MCISFCHSQLVQDLLKMHQIGQRLNCRLVILKVEA